MDFRTLGPSGIAALIASGETSAREVVTHALEKIGSDSTVRAFVSVADEQALLEADSVDSARAKGESLAPFAGVPIGVKDLEDAQGFVTTHGSVLHANDAPAMSDSILVERLRAAGCIVVGKTNTPEYGWKGDTHNALFGGTTNPWNSEFSAGGSSGGSAAAVAAGLVPLATASDGGGSIRIPASVCGLHGFKPSTGRIPVGGTEPPGWPDLSVKGVMTWDLSETVQMLDTIIGPDPTDRMSLPMPRMSWADAYAMHKLPAAVVWSPTLGYANVDGQVLEACKNAVDSLADAGVEIIEVASVFDQDPVGSFLALSGVGNLRAMEQFAGHPKWDQVDPVLQQVLAFADKLTAKEYLQHCDEGHRMNCALVDILHRGRVLLTPTVAGLPGPPGGVGSVNGVAMDNWVQLTYPFNLTRSPAGTVPVGLDTNGVPIGLQIVGPQHGDVMVLQTMAAISDVIDFRGAPNANIG